MHSTFSLGFGADLCDFLLFILNASLPERVVPLPKFNQSNKVSHKGTDKLSPCLKPCVTGKSITPWLIKSVKATCVQPTDKVKHNRARSVQCSQTCDHVASSERTLGQRPVNSISTHLLVLHNKQLDEMPHVRLCDVRKGPEGKLWKCILVFIAS